MISDAVVISACDKYQCLQKNKLIQKLLEAADAQAW
jgi:hypothetical protein